MAVDKRKKNRKASYWDLDMSEIHAVHCGTMLNEFRNTLASFPTRWRASIFFGGGDDEGKV